MAVTTIKYGDAFYYTEEDYDDVCRAIVDGKPLRVYERHYVGGSSAPVCLYHRITFFQDVDYVSVEL